MKVCIAQALLLSLHPFMHPSPLSHTCCWNLLHICQRFFGRKIIYVWIVSKMWNREWREEIQTNTFMRWYKELSVEKTIHIFNYVIERLNSNDPVPCNFAPNFLDRIISYLILQSCFCRFIFHEDLYWWVGILSFKANTCTWLIIIIHYFTGTLLG